MDKAPHKHTLKAAERVQRIVEQEEFIGFIKEIQDTLPEMPPSVPYYTRPVRDCGCPPTGICMNTACPRAARVTFS